MECVVSNHLSRFMFSQHPSSLFAPSNYVFYWKNKKREIDFVIELDGKLLPIEVKYSDNTQKDDVRGMNELRKTRLSYDFGIITSRSRLEIKNKHVIVPLAILLLLA